MLNSIPKKTPLKSPQFVTHVILYKPYRRINCTRQTSCNKFDQIMLQRFEHTRFIRYLSKKIMETKRHEPVHQALTQAGTNLKALQIVHAHIIITGLHKSRAILTKLITLAITAGSLTTYTRNLFNSVHNPDSFFFNSIIKCSSKFKLPREALFYYREMLFSGVVRTSYTFTSVIRACADLSALRVGRVLHSHVLVCGCGGDCFVEAGLVSFYAKCGDFVLARNVFDRMTVKTIVAWNSMISGYEQNGFGNEAILLFIEMRDLRVEFDSATFVSLLAACSQVGALELGCWVHDYIVENGMQINVVIGTSLINMYAKCGNVSKAREVYDSMSEKNVVACTAMIMGYGMHGHGEQAIEVFRQMHSYRFDPNHITFTGVLSACAHAGLVDEGRRVFTSMKQDYGLVPGLEHHVCFVDMLGRAGLLAEAYQHIKQQIGSNPPPAVWTAMLGACKMHKNFDLGVEVAERLLLSEPENPSHYVLLSNIYALAGKSDRVEMVRNVMIRRRLKKQIGYSTIEIDQKSYLFLTGDNSHYETTEIYCHIDELMRKCKDIGYVPDTESVLQDLVEEEKEYAVRYHSEKLAIAFGLLKTSGSKRIIRIVKNLRMCEDCHLAIKFISIVTGRELVVRDKLRFHHFKDGLCSCLDYW